MQECRCTRDPAEGPGGTPLQVADPATGPGPDQRAEGSRLHAYIVLCLMTGCRTEEARAMRWDRVNLEGDPDAEPPVPPHVAAWRSVRTHGDVKAEKSRRTLRLPTAVVDALKAHRVNQAEDRLLAGVLRRGQGLVFASAVGTLLDPSHVRRSFRRVCEDAGIGPRCIKDLGQ
jgi:integrase